MLPHHYTMRAVDNTATALGEAASSLGGHTPSGANWPRGISPFPQSNRELGQRLPMSFLAHEVACPVTPPSQLPGLDEEILAPRKYSAADQASTSA